MFLANNCSNCSDTAPSWYSFARKQLWKMLAQELPIASSQDSPILFVGECDPAIQQAAYDNIEYHVLLLTPNPFHALSEMAILRATTLYVVNHEHLAAIKLALEDRFGGTYRPRLSIWKTFPKTFEPIHHKRKLIGVIEPDFEASTPIFDSLFKATTSFTSILLQHLGFNSLLDVDLAFYCTNSDTFNRLSTQKVSVPLYDMNSDVSMYEDIRLMPEIMISLDTYRYNPILSGLAQRITVVRPWTLDKQASIAYELLSPVKREMVAAKAFSDIVNQLKAIKELDVSSFSDKLKKQELLGDLYGDYSSK